MEAEEQETQEMTGCYVTGCRLLWADTKEGFAERLIFEPGLQRVGGRHAFQDGEGVFQAPGTTGAEAPQQRHTQLP